MRFYKKVVNFAHSNSSFIYQRYLFRTIREARTKHGNKAKSPICLFIGGDTAIQSWWMEEVFLAHECASELNGYLFLLEHRFYGESIPSYALSLLAT